ncbi:MAG TPA: hypothetical protein VFS43_13230 [Polyangiaceae bacterium]|nr:hypothetical protein [Polyangiaceae bacterium]
MRRPPPSSLAALVLLWGPLALGADRDEAERLVTQTAQAPEAPAAARELDAARRALGRARGARDGGDRPSAELLEGLARTWAEAARDVVQAVRAEAALVQAQKALLEARSQVERGRALLEETISRKGRAQVELDRLDADAAKRRGGAAPRGGGPGGAAGQGAPKGPSGPAQGAAGAASGAPKERQP